MHFYINPYCLPGCKNIKIITDNHTIDDCVSFMCEILEIKPSVIKSDTKCSNVAHARSVIVKNLVDLYFHINDICVYFNQSHTRFLGTYDSAIKNDYLKMKDKEISIFLTNEKTYRTYPNQVLT